MMISLDDVILSLFPPLTTHLKHATTSTTDESSFISEKLSSSTLFPYDTVIAVIAVTYCRYTFCYDGESRSERLLWSALLGYLCLCQSYDYWVLSYVHIVSFSVFFYNKLCRYYDVYYGNNKNSSKYNTTMNGSASNGTMNGSTNLNNGTTTTMNGNGTTTMNGNENSANISSSSSTDDLSKQTQVLTVLGTALLIIGHLMYSISYPDGTNSFFESNLYKVLREISTERFPIISVVFASAFHNVSKTIRYLLPIEEFSNAHDVLIEFVDRNEFYDKCRQLLFVTFHIQVGMGYLGISFLRNEQSRKNALVKIEDDLKKEREQQQQQQNKEEEQQQHQHNNDSSNGNGNGNGNNSMMNGKNNGHNTKKVTVDDNDTAAAAACTTSTTEKKCCYNDHSAKFRKSAGPFIFCVAVPYMIQIVFYGGVNMYAFHCFRDDVHRKIRLNDLFSGNEWNNRFVATATSKKSNLSPDSYASNSETVVSTCYDMINRNLFSVPKLMLLPSIIAKQPMLVLQIAPLIFFSDWIKSTIVATITTEVERINKEIKDLESTRTKVEQYDLKNSELIQRSGRESLRFTERKWMKLTEDIQDRKVRTSIMARSKMYFAGLQRHFVMMALVDCALAKLIAVGKIFAADIFVYARAIEDMINFVLMKSRSESELATMQASIDVLKELKSIWDESEKRNLLRCDIVVNNINDGSSGGGSSLKIQGLSYTRGSASVSIDDVSIAPGVYAVTGANGSGKSTLFRIIMGCDTNAESVDIHASIKFAHDDNDENNDNDNDNDDINNNQGAEYYTIEMPSSDVVEITQNFYFPLYSAPFDWIYNIDLFDDGTSSSNNDSNNNNATKIEMTTKLENELTSLNFYSVVDNNDYDDDDTTNSSSSITTATTTQLRSDLLETKDDWFLDLSGGQKSKVELVRKVFLKEHCPDVLLIDETFAPLDPESKKLVMSKLKSFCESSIVLVIYHADVGKQQTTKQDNNDDNDGSNNDDDDAKDSDDDDHHEECVESSNFFDHNLHVENGSLFLRPVCAEN